METGRGSQAVIPINSYLAAAKDTQLKLLLRQRDTAKRRVQRAIEAEAQAEREIALYVAKTYPAPAVAESA